VRALPEHSAAIPSAGESACVAHPGCFTTAVLLAVVPLLALGVAEPRFAVTAITGSTGSGRGLSDKTHHPARRSNIAAYSPLAHRHAPEMAALAGEASGVRPAIDFVPLVGAAGARHLCLGPGPTRAVAPRGEAAALAGELAGFYAGSPFVAIRGKCRRPSPTSSGPTGRASGSPAATDRSPSPWRSTTWSRGRPAAPCSGSTGSTVFDQATGLEAASLGWF
jgi:N-acetyl-gamma-glutamylphosphate reductase